MLKESYFWFLQPSSVLNEYDLNFIYVFGGMFVAGVIIWVAMMFVKHQILKSAVKRWKNLLFYLGLSGMVWAAFRYENTPIFAKRFWVALIFLIGLVWLFYVLKYMFIGFSRDKMEYEENIIKNKYMPKSKK